LCVYDIGENGKICEANRETYTVNKGKMYVNFKRTINVSRENEIRNKLFSKICEWVQRWKNEIL